MMPLGSEIVLSSRQTYPVQSPQTLQENVPTPPSGLVFTDVDTQTSTAVIRSTSDMKLRSCSCKVKVKCQKCLDEKLKFQHFTLRPGWIFWLWSQSWGRRFCWSWRSQSPDCFYWKWFWMINEHANMQEADFYLLFFILSLSFHFLFMFSLICRNISILLISAAAAAAAWGVSVLHSVSAAICNTKYGLSAWIAAVAPSHWQHDRHDCLLATHSHSSVPARTLTDMGHFLAPDTHWILIPSSYSSVQKWGTNSCNIRPI